MNTAQKILVVEDAESYRWLLSQNLTEAGFKVATAKNGEEGLAEVKKDKPDLILLDIEMPIMDGVEMSKKIKEADIQVPIIFLTNMGDLKHISEAMETAVDYVIKSDISIDGIVMRVKDRLSPK